MGCDIHFFVERKINGQWQRVQEPEQTCETCAGKGVDEHRPSACVHCGDEAENHADAKCLFEHTTMVLGPRPCWWCNGTKVERPAFYRGRNYSLFARLADVRNSGEEEPLDDARGFPDDVSDELAAEGDWDKKNGGPLRATDWHSHSYFTLEELIHEDWSQWPDFNRTVKKLKKLGKPSEVRAIFFFDN